MSKTDDGGPVYPCKGVDEIGGILKEVSFRGLTRRDWLAGLAMQGLLASEAPGFVVMDSEDADGRPIPGTREPKIARRAYEQADAMIAESKEERAK